MVKIRPSNTLEGLRKSFGKNCGMPFYRVDMTTTKGRGHAWKDFKKKSTAEKFADRWMQKRIERRGMSASVKVKRVVKCFGKKGDVFWIR